MGAYRPERWETKGRADSGASPRIDPVPIFLLQRLSIQHDSSVAPGRPPAMTEVGSAVSQQSILSLSEAE